MLFCIISREVIVWSMLQYRRDKVSQCCHGYMTVLNYTSEQKVLFFSYSKAE